MDEFDSADNRGVQYRPWAYWAVQTVFSDRTNLLVRFGMVVGGLIAIAIVPPRVKEILLFPKGERNTKTRALVNRMPSLVHVGGV